MTSPPPPSGNSSWVSASSTLAKVSFIPGRLQVNENILRLTGGTDSARESGPAMAVSNPRATGKAMPRRARGLGGEVAELG